MLREIAFLSAFATIAVFVVAPLPATAAIDALSYLTPGQNTLNDTSGDIIVPGTGPSNTIVGVGTVLLSTFQFQSITNSNPASPLDINNIPAVSEITGLLAIQVTSEKVSAGTYTWTFAPVLSLASSTTVLADIGALSSTAATAMSTWNKGTLVAFYDDSTTHYSRQLTTVDQNVATAVNGTNIWQLGFTGLNGVTAAGEGWFASAATNDITLLPSSGFNGGSVNFAIDQTTVTPYSSLLLNGIKSTIDNTTLVQMNGNANILSNQSGGGPFQAWDNANAVIDVRAVPEPASLFIWLGAFLVGGFSLRRRLRRQ